MKSDTVTKQFKVKAYEVHSVLVEVDAASIEEAIDKANYLLEEGYYESGEYIDEPKYAYTLDPDEWDITEVNE